jgi:zinc transporter 1
MTRAHIRKDWIARKANESLLKNKSDRNKFYVMFAFTSLILLLELGIGIWAMSLALLADALHMLSDLLALVIGFYAVKYSQVSNSLENTFGLVRMEVVGALFNGAFLLSSSLFIILEAIDRLISFLTGAESGDALSSRAELVFIVGSVGLLCNIIGIFVFGHQGHHHHDHEHHHHEEIEDSREISEGHEVDEQEQLMRNSHSHSMNLNVRGVLLHIIGDALGSVAVLITAAVIQYTTWEYRILVDPICSLVISVILIFTTVPLLRKSVAILLHTAPSSMSSENIIQSITKEIPGVKGVHEFHIWQLSSKVTVCSLHVVIHSGHDIIKVLSDIKSMLHGFGIHSSTIQPEFSCINIEDSCTASASSSGSGLGSQACHDIVCGDECLDQLCCPLEY